MKHKETRPIQWDMIQCWIFSYGENKWYGKCDSIASIKV
jgi:hypothetical protein